MTETVELKPCPFCGQSMIEIEIEGFSNRMQKHMGHPDNGCFLAGSRVIVATIMDRPIVAVVAAVVLWVALIWGWVAWAA